MEEARNKSDCPRCRELEARNKELEARVQALEETVSRLSAALEEARRAGKRQAAPFRKPRAAQTPRKPGRKSGGDHGTHQHRAVPAAEEIDEVHDVPLPEQCPGCGSHDIQETNIAQQFQVELPQRPIHRRFDIHLGRCHDCGARVQGRHALQTSDALGAAASQLGPQVHAAMALLNKELGLSHGKVRRLLKLLFGIQVARATSVRSMLRTAERCRPGYAQLREDVRGSPQVVADETGWRVAGASAWLHVFVGQNATCYEIDPTRSAGPAERLLGLAWEGVLVHDGWSVYDRFTQAAHQQCLAHLLRRCEGLLEVAVRGAVHFPRKIQDLLRESLAVRNRFQAAEISRHGMRVLAGRLSKRLEALVAPVKRDVANERLAKFLERHQTQLFTHLRQPGIDATNWRAEQAIRPAVVNRKVWGGNRTQRGAEAQAVLTSVIRTCQQRLSEPLDYLAKVRSTPQPVLLPTMTR